MLLAIAFIHGVIVIRASEAWIGHICRSVSNFYIIIISFLFEQIIALVALSHLFFFGFEINTKKLQTKNKEVGRYYKFAHNIVKIILIFTKFMPPCEGN
ncbi:hypothetical protein HZS_1701 [Henneguya salminicola]|nr:hypothetical protein HZS_1701 [Henneguya salminicola]